MLADCPQIRFPKHLCSSATSIILLMLPAIAFAQEEKKKDDASFRETIHAFWIAQTQLVHWLIGLSSFAAAVWLLGGCVLGYVFFSIKKQDALSSVRWGYGFGAILWTLAALLFMWVIMEMHDPLWYIIIVISVSVIFGVMFGYFFRTQKATR